MKKLGITLLIFLIMIICTSAVSAADDAPALGASDDAAVSVPNTDTAVAADNDVKNFTELNDEITGYDSSTGDLVLSSDYMKNGTEDLGTITIEKNIVIDGNGSTINGSGLNKIFDIKKSYSVTLKNMTILGFTNMAISHYATLTLDSVTFTGSGTGSAVVSYGALNVTNCVFNDVQNGVRLRSGSTLISPCTVNVTASVDPNDWRKINYAAKVYDDNDNQIKFDDNTGTWKVAVYNETSTPTWDDGAQDGDANAASYGINLVGVNNTVLTNPTINTASVDIAPEGVNSEIEFAYSPDNVFVNDDVTLTITIKNYTDSTNIIPGEFIPTGKINITIDDGEVIQVGDLDNGVVTYTVNKVSAGTHTVKINYTGDDSFNPILNTEKSFTVNYKDLTQLQSDIDGATGELTLSTDYKYAGATDANRITIKKNLVIDGNGSTINAIGISDINEIIYANGGDLFKKYNIVLKNMIIVAEVTNVPYLVEVNNVANLTLDNVTFITSGIGYSVIGVSSGTLSVNNCIFKHGTNNYAINMASGTSLSLINNTYEGSSKLAVFRHYYETKLISPSTVNVTATCSPDWKTIAYSAKVYDDNGNEIDFDISTQNIWTVKFNDTEVASLAGAAGGISGSHLAVGYGDNVVSANNSMLANPTIKTATVNVIPEKVDSVISFTYTPGEPVWNDNVTLTITIDNYTDENLGKLSATGKIKLVLTTISTDPIYVDLINGSANYTINNINMGRWNVIVDYAGDDVFKENYTIYEFNVGQRAPEINVEIDNSTVGKQVFTITLPSDAKGKINATIDGVAYLNETELEDGKVSFTAELEPTTDAHTLVVKFFASMENDNYKNNETTLEFYSTRLSTNVTISVENTTYGNNVSFTITLDKGVDNATVVVQRGTDPAIYDKTVNLTDGSKTIDLGIIAFGEYTITVTSVQNAVYGVCTNSTLFNVSMATPVISINVGEHVLFEGVNVTVTVDPKAGKITLTDEKISFSDVKDLVNGTAKFTIPSITVGEHTVVAIFEPTDKENYTDGTQANVTFEVSKLTPTINVETGRVNIGQSASIEIDLTGNGAVNPTGFVLVMIGSQVINTAQLDDGKATVVIPESELDQLGNYTISVVYSTGTDTNYTANSTEYTFEVTKWDVVYTIDVNDFLLGQDVVLDITVNKDMDCLAELTENFTVVIKDSNNQTVNTTSVKLVDGVKSSFTYNIATAGEYTLEVSYAGDDKHFANSTSDVFNVRDLAGNLTIVVDSVNYPDRAVAVINASVDGNYRVYIKDIDRNYTVEVKNGLGNVTLDVLAADVTYEAHVVSLMEDYVAFNNKTTFTVNKGTIKAKFTINDVAYGNNVTVVVEDATADGVYNITENNVVVANVTVVSGQGSVNFAIDKAVGQYTYKLIAPTNANFTNSAGEVNQTTFNVTNATITVTVSVDDVKYLESILVVVTASVDGNYEIYIDGVDTTKFVKVEDGKGNETVALGAAYGVKTYNLTVNLTKDNYDPAGAKTTFTVNKADIIFNVDVEGYTYGATDKVGTLTTSVDGSAGKGYAIYIDDVNTVNITASGDTFDVSGLDAGTHTVKVVPIADDPNFANYNVGETVFNTTTFEVKKAEITLDVSVDKVTYPGNAIVKITTDVAGNYTVTAGTVTKEVTLVASASAQTVEIEGLDVGQYTAIVTSKNSNYTETTKSADFVVVNGTLSDITASVVVDDVPFATQPVAVVTSSVDGTFTVTVNGKPYTVVVKDGEGNTTISELLYVGNYPVKLTGDIEGYNPFLDETVSFNVNPADVGLTIEINNVIYPGKAVATVSANASGVYNITVGDYVYSVTIETAAGTMASVECTLDVLSATTHTANVKKVNDDGNFTSPAQNETDFTERHSCNYH